MSKTLGALIWVAGVVLAKGFWLTLLAVVFPLYGAFLVVMKLLAALGWVS